MKYIVTYLIIKLSIVPCQQAQPSPDEFGRVRTSYQTTLATCYREDTTRQVKHFDSLHLAKAFIQKGKEDSAGIRLPVSGYSSSVGFPVEDLGRLANFKLETVKK